MGPLELPPELLPELDPELEPLLDPELEPEPELLPEPLLLPPEQEPCEVQGSPLPCGPLLVAGLLPCVQ